MTLNSAERKPAAGSEYADPPRNENYVLLDVKRDERRNGWHVALPHLRLGLRAADGHEYNVAAFAGYDPQLNSGELIAGSKARGPVVLDAPAGPLTAGYTAGFGAPAT
ncbi:MAG TPA: hypothetical protein VES60_17585 [Nakamurella sp.]|nr:hypothetical protein [Nakamurella sp.]